jgi:hypothetical protein
MVARTDTVLSVTHRSRIMHASTLGTHTIDVSRLISNMQGKLRAAKKELRATKAAEAAARAETRAYWRRIDLLKAKRLTKNMAAATAGLTRIIEFAKRPEIQRLIKLEGELRHMRILSGHDDGKGEFMLFYLDYVDPSNDNLAEMHDQHAGIFLKPDSVLLTVRDYDDHAEIEIALDTPHPLKEVLDLANIWKESATKKRPLSVRKALSHSFTGEVGGGLIHADTLSVSRGMNPLLMWEGHACDTPFPYNELFGRVLIDCADEKKFARYCEAAIAWLTRE